MYTNRNTMSYQQRMFVIAAQARIAARSPLRHISLV